MKKFKLKWHFIILIGIIIAGYLFPLSLEQLKSWLILHPEFVENNFFYINEKTNKEIDYNVPIEDRVKWKYYDTKVQNEMYMQAGLKEALLNELKTAYDKIDTCKELDEYRETIDRRRKETNYKLLFDQGLKWNEFGLSYSYDWDPKTQTLTIRLNTDFVDNCLGYLSSSHSGKLIMDSASGGHVTLSQTLAHELLHLWLDKNGSDSAECTVWSLEKKCLDENTDIPKEFRCKCKEYTWDDCKNPPPGGGDSSSSTDFTPPIRRADRPDDNFSYAAVNYTVMSLLEAMNSPQVNIDKEFSTFRYYPDILVYNKFKYPDLHGLLEKYNGFS